ncbi:hypothetical protein ABK040_011571 [Willaertia magna]
MVHFTKLPTDLLFHIFSFIDNNNNTCQPQYNNNCKNTGQNNILSSSNNSLLQQQQEDSDCCVNNNLQNGDSIHCKNELIVTINNIQLTCKFFNEKLKEFDNTIWKNLLQLNFLNKFNYQLTKQEEINLQKLTFKTSFKLINFILKKELKKQVITKMEEQIEEWKFVILGSSGVGKTSCVVRLTMDVFIDQYDPGVEEYRKIIDYNGNKVYLEIIDGERALEEAELRYPYIRRSDGFILMCDINNLQSLQDLNIFIKDISLLKESSIFPCVIIVNKCDNILQQQSTQQQQLKNLKDKVTKLLKEQIKLNNLNEMKNILFTSIKENINVKEIFKILIEECRLFKIDIKKVIDLIIKKRELILLEDKIIDIVKEKRKCLVM